MKLKDILKSQAVCGDLLATDKKGVLEELSKLAEKAYPGMEADHVFKVLLERERLGSTGVGNGISIPHGKMPGLSSIVAIFGRSKKGVDFQAHDQIAAKLFFVLIAPENVVGNHLQALARLSRLLKGEAIRNQLIESPSEDLYQILINEDEKL
ncbi:MAG TPA: PTS fructose transporter subunit IIA [Deltaproteobacteria bacterium]|nr:MAG: PTS fructose transporter subunit IIA [Deltaproteobacteria bacterium GWA2_45_12]HBF13219.1 PTS fructose transporter subunit IIA [Deltaproteobacteria bacterium]